MKKLLILAALVAPLAHAEFFSGNDIHKWSQESASSNVSWGMMYGYIAGVYDTTRGISQCSPANIQLQQIVDMVKNHVADNPATRHYSADIITAYVLKQAWPCADKKKGTAL